MADRREMKRKGVAAVLTVVAIVAAVLITVYVMGQSSVRELLNFIFGD